MIIGAQPKKNVAFRLSHGKVYLFGINIRKEDDLMQLREMLSEVNDFFRTLGVDYVDVNVCSDKSNVAGARGIYVNGIVPLLNLHINAAWGEIRVDAEYLNRQLTRDEQMFILAHEVFHIYLNHVIARFPLEAFNKLLRHYDIEVSITLDLLKWLLYALGIPPPISSVTKEHELAADIQAIYLTRNYTAAISCLTKLVDGNLDSHSHTWEVLGVKLPVMTMRERIDEIRRRVGEISRYIP